MTTTQSSESVKRKLTREERSKLVEENLPVIEEVVSSAARKGKIAWTDVNDWFQSLVAIILEWDYIFDRYEVGKPLFPFLSRIFSGMLSDRFNSKDAFDGVTGDCHDFRRSTTDIDTATEIIGIGATEDSDRHEMSIAQQLVELDRELLDGMAEFLREHLGPDFYTVYQLSRIIRKASEIASESGIANADVYKIKAEIERLSRHITIGGQELSKYRAEMIVKIKRGCAVGEIPVLNFEEGFPCSDRAAILEAIKPRSSRSWSEKYDDQMENEIASAEIFRLMGDRVKRFSNPYEWLKTMVRKGLIRITRVSGESNHSRYYYDRRSAMELIDLLDNQQEHEAIEAVRDRLLREANEAEAGRVPSQLRPRVGSKVEPAVE